MRFHNSRRVYFLFYLLVPLVLFNGINSYSVSQYEFEIRGTVSEFLYSSNGDDIFEENDDFSSAPLITKGFYPNLVAADEDWYNVSVNSDEQIEITIYFEHSQGDLDLALYDSSQVLIDASNSATDNEAIYFDVIVSGNYTFRVYYGTNPSYSMNIALTHDPILIDGDGAQNWAWAVGHDWCRGNGNWNDPYIIDNLTINAGGVGNGIEVRDSTAFFEIRNCTLYNSGDLSHSNAGLRLYNVMNGYLINNTCSFNNRDGIFLIESSNNSVINNRANHNDDNGIHLYGDMGICEKNTIFGNVANFNLQQGLAIQTSSKNNLTKNTCNGNSEGGITLIQNSNNNKIQWNNVSDNAEGIDLHDSDFNTILGNNITDNNHGIDFYSSNSNNITGNLIKNNVYNGILIRQSSNNLIIFKNNITSHGNYGIEVQSPCYDNLVYFNKFIGNTITAWDDGSNNDWDNGSFGNFWDDYSGKDINDDGLGDDAYIVPGTAGRKDAFPLWWDPPVISIISPQADEILDGGPLFSISIDEGIANTTWYTIDNGITNIFFTGIYGKVSQTEWDKQVDGPITIRFNANDSRGYIGFDEVIVKKNTTPIITIISPHENQVFGFNAPEFNITINDLNFINTTWYTIDNGITNYTGFNDYPFSRAAGYINQTAWDNKEDGILTLRFYANDSVGYLGFKDVTIVKDTIAPIISINLPTPNQMCGIIAPDFDIQIDDLNPLEKWYSLNGGQNITFTTETQFNQTEWDKIGNETVTITFYAKDKAGNVNFSQIVVLKDNYQPQINIISPTINDIFENIAPHFMVEIIDSNLDTMWYTIDEGLTNITFTDNGSIDSFLWNAILDGNVNLKFYANDTAGNVNFESVNIIKDTAPPIITIISPNSNEVFGINAPTFEILIDEANLESSWYTIDGGLTNITFSGLIGSIDQNVWDSASQGEVSILFYARDVVNKIGMNSVIVVKTIPSEEISGYNLILFIGAISIISAVLMKRQRQK